MNEGLQDVLGSQDSSAPTFFAPGERELRETVLQQATLIQGSPLAEIILNAGLDCTMILNSKRQIVAASRNVLELTKDSTIDALLGMRPGEALGCVHAARCESGCGTSEFCRECGAVRAIMTGLAGSRCIQECRMTRVVDGMDQSLDLQVLASPLEFRGERFTLIALHDISHEKRRRALERIFFHDVINLAGGMEGLLLNLREVAPPEIKEEVDLSYSTIREMIEEIVSQRDLTAAEQNELPVFPAMANSLKLIHQVANIYRNHPVSEKRQIVVNPEAVSLEFITDANLLRRVIGNLVKNAAEASRLGETVTLSCELGGGNIAILVNNPQVMTREVQHQIFQRSFSTKGVGRGLGTYSVKLIAEKFLKGSVSFTSVAGQGTTFKVILPLTLK